MNWLERQLLKNPERVYGAIILVGMVALTHLFWSYAQYNMALAMGLLVMATVIGSDMPRSQPRTWRFRFAWLGSTFISFIALIVLLIK